MDTILSVCEVMVIFEEFKNEEIREVQISSLKIAQVSRLCKGLRGSNTSLTHVYLCLKNK